MKKIGFVFDFETPVRVNVFTYQKAKKKPNLHSLSENWQANEVSDPTELKQIVLEDNSVGVD